MRFENGNCLNKYIELMFRNLHTNKEILANNVDLVQY